MTWTRANPLGWALWEVLTSTQMNTLDIDHTEAVDGVGGGTYAPTAPVIFDPGKLQAQPDTTDIVWPAMQFPGLASRTATRLYALPPLRGVMSNFGGAGDDWIMNATTGVIEQNYVDVTGTNKPLLEFWFDPRPVVGTLTKVYLRLQPAGAHAGLPSVKPWMQVNYNDDGADTSLSADTDSSGDVTAYELAHYIESTTLTEGIDPAYFKTYKVRVTGEAGTNGLVGLQLYFLRTAMTVDRIWPG